MAQVTRKQEDILRLLASNCHVGTKNLCNSMEGYVDSKSNEGVHIFNVEKIWQKIQLAARAIVTVENKEDVIVVSARPYGQRAVIKYAHYTGCLSTSTSRWTPGTLTNQNTKIFKEPRLIIVTDPRSDRQAVVEASFVNIPCIALCDTDSNLEFIDVAIPCNNRSTESISMIYWLLAREVNVLRGNLTKDQEWDVMVDLFYFKQTELDTDKDEEDQKEELALLNENQEKGRWDETQEKPTENEDNWE